MPRAVATGLAIMALSAAAPVRAHESPTGLGLAWTESAADALPVVITNRGLVFPSKEAPGLRFALRCNEAYGVTTAALPNLLIDASGAVVLQTTLTVSTTADRGCSYQSGTGLPADISLGGFAQDPTAPNKLLVTTQTYEAESQILASDDYGKTWSARGANAKSSVYDALLFAADGKTVFAGGARFDAVRRALVPIWATSRDAGKTFRDEDLTLPRMPVGVHPQKPEVLFARETSSTGISDPHDRLLRSTDGGATFTSVLELKSLVTAFTATPDASLIWVGTNTTGLYVSRDGGARFERVKIDDILAVRCLQYRQDRLWVCATMAPNTHGIYASSDRGDTFSPMLTFDQVTEQVACTNTPKNVCEMPWRDWERELLSEPGRTDAGAASGPPIVTADGGKARADAGVADGDDTDDMSESSSRNDDGGCAMHATARDADSLVWWMFGLLALVRRRTR